jgi:hypothetical protein
MKTSVAGQKIVEGSFKEDTNSERDVIPEAEEKRY